MRKVLFLGLLVAVLLSGCVGQYSDDGVAMKPSTTTSTTRPTTTISVTDSTITDSESTTTTQMIDLSGWRNAEFTDISSGSNFRVSDFEGKPVLLESFAAWCSTCTSQQNKIKELHEQIGDDVISISLDTDPNEDKSSIVEHLDRHGFDWYYSIASIETTRKLIDEFGITIASAPQAPVILVCPDQTNAKLLRNGVKSADELLTEIEGC